MRNTSIILEHSNSSDHFEIFTSWLKSHDKSSLLNLVNLKESTLLNNPSFRFINPEGESIKIDDIRKLKQELAFSSYDNKKRYFIFFNFNLATLQAQNASLKLIEEPPPNTQIVLLTSTLDKLIPTVTSRCEVVPLKTSGYQVNQLKEVAKVYEIILNSKHYELIELAGKYKERETANQLLSKLLNYLNFELHKKDSKYSKKQLRQHLAILLETINLLSKNVNVKLAVENCFFRFV